LSLAFSDFDQLDHHVIQPGLVHLQQEIALGHQSPNSLQPLPCSSPCRLNLLQKPNDNRLINVGRQQLVMNQELAKSEPPVLEPRTLSFRIFSMGQDQFESLDTHLYGSFELSQNGAELTFLYFISK
jgi:hypothetical protein